MISIIVPVYKVEKYLAECIDSILDQTCKDFELILVDDGSPDHCGEICDTYEKRDPRIHVIHQNNQGLSGARNTGTQAASGEYITYIDSDDVVAADYLETLLELQQKENADIAVLPFQKFSVQMEEPKKEENGYTVISGYDACKRLMHLHESFLITAWGKLYKSSLKELLQFPEGKVHEEEFVTYKVLYASERVVIGKMPLYGYRQRQDSITSGVFTEKRLDRLTALFEAVQWFGHKGESELKLYAQKRYLLNLEISWYQVHKGLTGRNDLEQSLTKKHREFFKENKQSIFSVASAFEKITVVIFQMSPVLYGFIAGIVLRISSQVR